MLSAREVIVLGYALVCYIILYAVYLAFLCFSAMKETKLIRRYENGNRKKGNRHLLIVIAVLGAIAGIALIYIYVKYA